MFPLRIFTEPQQGASYESQLAVAQEAEALGFDAFFRSDHYLRMGRDPAGPEALPGPTDSWVTLGALGRETSRIRLGTLVTSATFRLPGPLAISVAQVDAMSGGRVELGLGAGWFEAEHSAYGIPFPPVRERFERLEEQLAIVHSLLTEDRVTFQGKHYRLDDCEFLPKPVQTPRPPIILGGRTVGPWMQRLIGAYADEFNTVGGTPEMVAERFERARGGVAAAGRPADSLTTSLMTWTFLGTTQEEYLARVERARSLDPTAGEFPLYLADVEKDCIVGTPDRAAARLSEYADAGVQRIFLNHELYDDLEMLELLAKDVLPRVTP